MTRRADLTITIPPRVGVSITLHQPSIGVAHRPYDLTLTGSTKETTRWRARVQTKVDPIWGEPDWETAYFPLDDLPAAIQWVETRRFAGLG